MSEYDLEKQAEEASNLYELAYLNDQVAIKARPDGKYIRFKKPVDRPTQEAIDEYNEQFEVGKQVDEEGRVKKFFVPENIPELVAFNPTVSPALSFDEKAQLQVDLEVATVELSRLERYLQELDDYKQKVRNTLNEADIQFWSELQIQITETDLEIGRINRDIQSLQRDIEFIYAIRSQDSSNISTYQKELQEVKKTNQERINSYKEELNRMNRGAFTMSQDPGETEEEFLRRLSENAESLEPDELENKAIMNALRNFKAKMKELIRDEIIIGQVSNRIDNFGQIENKMKLLKTFPKFKKYFIEKYGFNNKQVTPQVLIEEIEKYIKKHDAPQIIVDQAVDDLFQAEEAVLEAPQFTATIKKPFQGLQYQAQPEAFRMKVENLKEEPSTVLYLRPVLIGRTKELLFSFTGNNGSWIDFRDTKIDRKTSDIIRERTGILLKELELAFGAKTIKGIAQNLFQQHEIPFSSNVELEPDVYHTRNGDVEITRYAMGIKRNCSYGYGLPEEIPKFAKLGKAVIMPKKLFYENVLSLAMANGSKFPGFKNVKVSEKFVEIIMELLKGNKPSYNVFKLLDIPEREIYDQMVYLAGLHKTIEHTGEQTIESLKHRLDLIQGEIGVGNDNPDLIKELKSIIKRLVEMKFLTAKSAKEYLAQF